MSVPASTSDFAAAGLLDGLDGDARDQRLQLLEWLTQRGFDLTDLQRAHRRGLLVFLAAASDVGGPPRYSLREVAAAAGADPERLARLRRAAGLPVADLDAIDLNDVDIDSARTLQAWSELGLSDEQMVQTTRALGAGLSRAAEAMRAVMAELVVEPGASEKELAAAYAATVHEAMPLVGPMVQEMLTQHLRNIVEAEVVGTMDLAAGRPAGTRDLTVAFADLVGFTRLGEEIPPEDLGRVAERLVDIVGDVLPDEVRLVKTIGDAVLLTALEPTPLITTGLALIDAVTEVGEDFPQVRIGVAHGATIARGGDVYGRAVNLASRVTTIARAGSVLGTRDVRDGAREAFRWSSAGARRIKGLPEPVPLYRARPLEAAS